MGPKGLNLELEVFAKKTNNLHFPNKVRTPIPSVYGGFYTMYYWVVAQ
jgi:hypothetical protein